MWWNVESPSIHAVHSVSSMHNNSKARYKTVYVVYKIEDNDTAYIPTQHSIIHASGNDIRYTQNTAGGALTWLSHTAALYGVRD